MPTATNVGPKLSTVAPGVRRASGARPDYRSRGCRDPALDRSDHLGMARVTAVAEGDRREVRRARERAHRCPRRPAMAAMLSRPNLSSTCTKDRSLPRRSQDSPETPPSVDPRDARADAPDAARTDSARPPRVRPPAPAVSTIGMRSVCAPISSSCLIRTESPWSRARRTRRIRGRAFGAARGSTGYRWAVFAVDQQPIKTGDGADLADIRIGQREPHPTGRRHGVVSRLKGSASRASWRPRFAARGGSASYGKTQRGQQDAKPASTVPAPNAEPMPLYHTIVHNCDCHTFADVDGFGTMLRIVGMGCGRGAQGDRDRFRRRMVATRRSKWRNLYAKRLQTKSSAPAAPCSGRRSNPRLKTVSGSASADELLGVCDHRTPGSISMRARQSCARRALFAGSDRECRRAG